MSADLVRLYIAILIPMLAFRIGPLLALKGSGLLPDVRGALDLIPPAAFAALVANDILQPTLLQASPLQGVRPIVAAFIVVPIARKTGSLVISAIVGMAAYALLGYAFALAG